MKEKTDFSSHKQILRSISNPRYHNSFIPQLSNIWSINKTLKEIDKNENNTKYKVVKTSKIPKSYINYKKNRRLLEILIKRNENSSANSARKSSKFLRKMSVRKPKKSMFVKPASLMQEKISVKVVEEEPKVSLEPVPSKEYTYNNMYGLFCFQNLLRRKVRFMKEKKEFEMLTTKKTRSYKYRAHEKQLKAEEAVKALRSDRLLLVLSQKTRNFMTGCMYDSVIKIAMGKVLAVILSKYIQRSFGNNQNYKMVVHTTLIECTGQGVIVGSRCLLEKGVDKILSFQYRFCDAASIVNIYLFT